MFSSHTSFTFYEGLALLLTVYSVKWSSLPCRRPCHKAVYGGVCWGTRTKGRPADSPTTNCHSWGEILPVSSYHYQSRTDDPGTLLLGRDHDGGIFTRSKTTAQHHIAREEKHYPLAPAASLPISLSAVTDNFP